MKTIILVLIILFAFNLFAEDSLQVKTKEQLQLQQGEMIQNREKIHANDNDNDHDVFIDKNSDGIADDRNFQERHRYWGQNDKLSRKVFRSGSYHEWQNCQGGQSSQGDQVEPGQGNGQCPGNGGGHGG